MKLKIKNLFFLTNMFLICLFREDIAKAENVIFYSLGVIKRSNGLDMDYSLIDKLYDHDESNSYCENENPLEESLSQKFPGINTIFSLKSRLSQRGNSDHLIKFLKYYCNKKNIIANKKIYVFGTGAFDERGIVLPIGALPEKILGVVDFISCNKISPDQCILIIPDEYNKKQYELFETLLQKNNHLKHLRLPRYVGYVSTLSEAENFLYDSIKKINISKKILLKNKVERNDVDNTDDVDDIDIHYAPFKKLKIEKFSRKLNSALVYFEKFKDNFKVESLWSKCRDKSNFHDVLFDIFLSRSEELSQNEYEELLYVFSQYDTQEAIKKIEEARNKIRAYCKLMYNKKIILFFSLFESNKLEYLNRINKKIKKIHNEFSDRVDRLCYNLACNIIKYNSEHYKKNSYGNFLEEYYQIFYRNKNNNF